MQNIRLVMDQQCVHAGSVAKCKRVPNDHLPFGCKALNIVGSVLEHLTVLIATLSAVVYAAHSANREVQRLLDNVRRNFMSAV